MGPSSSIASSKVPSQRPSVSSASALSPASFAPKSQPAAAPQLPLPPNTSINAPPASLSPTVLHIAPSQRSQPEPPILLVGISGSPSSGKTTLSHLLITLFPPGSIVFNFREDDFLFPSKHLSNTENADHHMAIDFDALIRTLRAVKEEGRLPADWKTTQRTDTEGMGTGEVPRPEVVDALRKEVADSLGAANNKRKFGIVAGSLLYHDPVIMEMLDVKLLLRVSKAAAKERRFIRRNSGTPAVREFWRTPEFYDKVAWPTFVKEYAYLFHHGDVEGPVKRRLSRELEIDMQPELEGSMEETLRWAVKVILRDLEGKTEKSVLVDTGDRDDRYEICRCRAGILGRVRQFLFDSL